MQIKLTTDYAIRCALYLAAAKRTANATEIGNAMGVTPAYISKVLRSLRKEGLVYSVKGVEGGYCLAKPAAEIAMGDIITAMEDTVRINRCLEADGYCSRNGVEIGCPVHDWYKGLQALLDDYFGKTTVQDIWDGKAR